MGAGDFLAGDEDAGDDLVFPVPPRRVVPPWQALHFDASTRDFPVDTKGFYKALHPVDARVAMAMVQFEGVIKCLPVGNRLRKIRYLDVRTKTSVAYEVRRVLLDEITGNNITVEEIVVETTPLGGLAVLLRYKNLRLLNAKPKTVQVLVNG